MTLDDGAAVACDMERLDLPGKGWSDDQAREALRVVDERLTRDGHTVAAVYIEQPALVHQKASFDAGRAVQEVWSASRRRWPHAPLQVLQPSSWRRYAGIKGNATKAEVFAEAVRLWSAAGLPAEDVESWAQDAADALLIATAGFHSNEEIIEKAAARAQG